MSQRLKIIIRTEGNQQLGMGDVSLGIALAKQLAGKGISPLLIGHYKETYDFIRNEGFRFKLLKSYPEEINFLKKEHPNILLVCKIFNSKRYLSSITRHTDFLVLFDNVGTETKQADLNINVLYPIDGALCDLKYICLRDEFITAHNKKKIIRNKVKNIIIMQGGSDTYGFIPKIIKAVHNLEGHYTFQVIIGPAFRHYKKLNKVIKTINDPRFIIYNSVKNMATMMFKADLAITAGGISMFELACVGTPSLISCAEPFEEKTASRFQKENITLNLGFGADITENKYVRFIKKIIDNPGLRRLMSANGKRAINGKGSGLIVQIILKRFEDKSFKLEYSERA